MNHLHIQAIENQAENINPVFVVGSARSGTGMIARAIAKSRKLCYLGETGIFSHVIPCSCPFLHEFNLNFRMTKSMTFDHSFLHFQSMRLKDFIFNNDRISEFVRTTHLYTKIGSDQISLQPSNPLHQVLNIRLTGEEEEVAKELISKYSKLLKEDPFQFVRICFEDFRILSQRERIVEKTPNHLFFLPEIWQSFPRASLVITDRQNRRDMLASFYLMTRSTRKLRRFIREYERTQEISNRQVSDHPAQVKVVSYSDFLEAPLKSITDIYKFLDLPIEVDLESACRDIKLQSSKYEKLTKSDKLVVDRFI